MTLHSIFLLSFCTIINLFFRHIYVSFYKIFIKFLSTCLFICFFFVHLSCGDSFFILAYFCIKVYCSASLPRILRLEIKIAIPTVRIENRSTIDPTIQAVSPLCIDNFTFETFKSPKEEEFFNALHFFYYYYSCKDYRQTNIKHQKNSIDKKCTFSCHCRLNLNSI